MHCLTSGLFRKEFYNVFNRCSWNNNRRIGVLTQMFGETTRTQTGVTRLREKQKQQERPIETIH